MTHQHNFKSWTFKESVDTGTFTTRPVMEGLLPILDVYHSGDGSWQFLCGTTLDVDDLKLVCFGCIVEGDSTVLELADLPTSWRAFRDTKNDAWSREKFDEEDDGG